MYDRDVVGPEVEVAVFRGLALYVSLTDQGGGKDEVNGRLVQPGVAEGWDMGLRLESGLMFGHQGEEIFGFWFMLSSPLRGIP